MTTIDPGAAKRRLAWATKVQRRFPLLQIFVLAILVLYGFEKIPGFTGSPSIRAMLVLAALLGLASIGQTLVIICGGLDASVSGFIVMGDIVISELCGSHGWSFVPALLVIVAIAAVGGALSGWICRKYWINSLVVTLGVGSLALGGCLAWTGANLSGEPPRFLSTLVSAGESTFGIPVAPVVVIIAGITIALAVILHKTIAGRKIYATGINSLAADRALIRTSRVWLSTYAVSAVLSALVGVLLAGYSGPDQSVGDPYLFQGIAAVIVGGTAWGGARGDYTHTILGALLLTVLATVLVGLGYSAADQEIVFGVIILVVVAGYGRLPQLRDRL
jgi:ribose transport system permease protein